MKRTITSRIRGTWLRYFTVALVAVLVAAPATVWASNTFTDVADSNIFHDDIEWMADTGITQGCGGGNFCPGDDVTRQQMSAFMHRSATNLTPRAAFDSSGNLVGGNGTALTATITAPAAGLLIINANVELLRTLGATDEVVCQVEIDDTVVTGSSMSIGVDLNAYEICSTGGAAVVDAGVHEIDLEMSGLELFTLMIDGFLTVQWVPFDGDGEVPVP